MIVEVSDVLIWSMVETGVGISAGSAPALRPLLRSISFFGSSQDSLGKPSEVERGRGLSTYAMEPIGGSRNLGFVSARCSRGPMKEESESMKDILRDERVLITSTIVMEDHPRRSHFRHASPQIVSP